MLKAIPPEQRVDQREDWLELVWANPEFAKDYCELLTFQWGLHSTDNGDECLFHDHTQQSLPDEAGRAELAMKWMPPPACPFRGWGCILEVAPKGDIWDFRAPSKMSKKEKREKKEREKEKREKRSTTRREVSPTAMELAVEKEPPAWEEAMEEPAPDRWSLVHTWAHGYISFSEGS
jgi:hypothetical protein